MAEQPLLPFDEPEDRPPSSRLVSELARVCAEMPLEEKVLVAPSLAIGHQIVERLAREGHDWIHLRVETVRSLAHARVGPELAREGWRLLSRAQALALVEQACTESLGARSYFGGLRERPGLHRAIQATLDELRAAGLEPSTLPRRAFADAGKHRDLREIFARFLASLEQGRYADGIEVLRRALAAAGKSSPPEATFLIPEDAELSSLERRFLDALAGEGLRRLPADAPEDWPRQARKTRLFRAIGEENEIREVLRRALAEGLPFDEVEILHTDAASYPALAWELSREHGIPATFAGGVAVTFSNPGRAALAFLDWIAGDFAADVLREALASGVLSLRGLSPGEPATGRAVARAFREAGIGWGRDRHIRCLDRLVARLERPEHEVRRDEERTEDEISARVERRARRLAEARCAREFAVRAVAFAPSVPDGPGDLGAIARGAREFVSAFGRVAGDLDATALTALESLLEEFEELPALALTAARAVSRLRDAVSALHVAPDRPRPGRIHVSHYTAGGFSGRRHTFLVGLDARRHPGPDLEDPVLLDEERRRINDKFGGRVLALGRESPLEASAALHACVSRLRGSLSASYSSFDIRNLSQAGEPAASPFFLDLFRQASGKPDADYRALDRAQPEAAGFVPGEEAALDETEWWLSRLRLAGAAGGSGAPVVRALYPWLADGHRAETARDSEEFTVYDGRILSGTPELDPRTSGRPFSATRIQELASCPFAYFVRHVLRVRPPDDLERDPTRWLDPLDEGTLLHEVFRAFFEKITASGEKPRAGAHEELILSIAEERIGEWRERIPPRSGLAFGVQRENIRFACSTLLRLEEEHCRDVTPRWFEVPFGRSFGADEAGVGVASPDPVVISIGGGARIHLRGSIDRVDEAADGTFHVWDYKTGSAFAVREGRGVRGGRQIQPALYAMAFEGLLDRAGRPGKVSRSGYFFPGRKGEGLRVLGPADRSSARDALARLFDLLSAGMFPHGMSKDDCRYCDFESICGGPDVASRRSAAKLRKSEIPELAAFRAIHDEKKR